MAAIKFWAINNTGSYRPENNIPVTFSGNIGPLGMTGIANTITSGMSAIGATALRIVGNGIGKLKVSAIGTGTVTFGTTYTGGQTGLVKMQYYNGLKPAYDIDGPITGFIANVDSVNAFSFADYNGNTATFAAGTIKLGTVYPFAVGGTVYTVTSGHIIGYSEW